MLFGNFFIMTFYFSIVTNCREVHEMFLEISNLVTQQGEMVDNIEHVTIQLIVLDL